jgi:acyl carrier protein
MDTITKLRGIFEAYFALPLNEFGETTTPAQIEKWDSTAHVGLVLEIERQFDLEFNPSELGRLTSVGAIRHVLESKLAELR